MEKVKNNTEVLENNHQTNNEAYKKQLNDLNLRHLGFNLSNLSIVLTCFMALLFLGQIVAVLVGFLFAALLFCFLLLVTIATLGIVYFTTDFGKLWGLFGKITDGGTTFIEFLQKLMISIPYVSALGILSGVGAILCYSFCKRYRSVGRIVTSGIMIGICLILFILYFAGVGKWTN